MNDGPRLEIHDSRACGLNVPDRSSTPHNLLRPLIRASFPCYDEGVSWARTHICEVVGPYEWLSNHFNQGEHLDQALTVPSLAGRQGRGRRPASFSEGPIKY
ncbi:hypothetical protein PGT21_030282 [Puccinia graminis f. sp. tritici]|nr:hypothetical protein PGT21_030282 [Puccinia graminis f. sp. tritici]